MLSSRRGMGLGSEKPYLLLVTAEPCSIPDSWQMGIAKFAAGEPV
jgi:hypothetical protein